MDGSVIKYTARAMWLSFLYGNRSESSMKCIIGLGDLYGLSHAVILYNSMILKEDLLDLIYLGKQFSYNNIHLH